MFRADDAVMHQRRCKHRCSRERGTFGWGQVPVVPVLSDSVWISESGPLETTGQPEKVFQVGHVYNGDTDRRGPLGLLWTP